MAVTCFSQLKLLDAWPKAAGTDKATCSDSTWLRAVHARVTRSAQYVLAERPDGEVQVRLRVVWPVPQALAVSVPLDATAHPGSRAVVDDGNALRQQDPRKAVFKQRVIGLELQKAREVVVVEEVAEQGHPVGAEHLVLQLALPHQSA